LYENHENTQLWRSEWWIFGTTLFLLVVDDIILTWVFSRQLVLLRNSLVFVWEPSFLLTLLKIYGTSHVNE